MGDTVLIGGYTNGNRTGLERVALGDGERLGEVALDNPSWLVTEPGGVLAIGENQPSTVTLVASDLTAGPSVELSGEHACHAALYGDFLVVANYGSGSVSVVELDAAGAPVRDRSPGVQWLRAGRRPAGRAARPPGCRRRRRTADR